MELRFRIPWAGFRIPKPSIPDSTSKNFLDSGIRIPLHGAKLFPVPINVHTIAAGHVSENTLYTDLFCQNPASMHLYDNYRGFPYLVKVMLGCFEFPF